MADLAEASDAELLRLAIREATSESVDANFELGQLYAGFVLGRADLQQTWEEETAPEEAELDLHLEGPGVAVHSTRADHLAAFVSGMNTAVKSIAKQRLGTKRHSRNLLIEGASQGSVRLVLRAEPVLPPNPKTDNNTVPDTAQLASSSDSEALRSIARLFTIASATEGEPSVLAEVRELPNEARKALRRCVEASRMGDWEIDGLIRQRGLGVAPVSFTRSGASVLRRELEDDVYASSVDWAVGTVDGFRRVLGMFYFTPNTGGGPVAVGVQDSAVLTNVTKLAAEEGTQVLVQVETITASASADGNRGTTSRLLLDIKPAEPAAVQTELL